MYALKLLSKRGGLTIPASGIGGDWIVKLPSVIYPKVSENEAAMLTLAAQIGLEVPEHRLIPLNEIEGLPQLGDFASRQALAIKRFDRGPDGQRIHMEDLAQVFGIMPYEKYEHVGFARIAEMTGLVMGPAAVQDFIARLVVMILTGNGDMHLKNWSLLYPDGRTPVLSPSYDLVSTIPYIPEDGLALNFAGKKKFGDINKEHFQRLAEKAQISERETMLTVERITDATIATWDKLKPDTAMDDAMVQQIDQHMKAMARKLK